MIFYHTAVPQLHGQHMEISHLWKPLCCTCGYPAVLRARPRQRKNQFFLLLIFPLFFHRVLVVPPHTVRAYHHHNHHHLSRGPNAEALLLRLIQWSFMLYNIATSSLSVAEEACKKKLRRGKNESSRSRNWVFMLKFFFSLSLLFYALCFTFSFFFFTRSLHLLLFHSLTHSARRTAM